MEIRSQSRDGPLVSPLAEISAKVSQQLDAVTPQWLEQLHRDPASGARLEVEIHDHFRRLADQMTASFVAESTIPGGQAEPGREGTPIGPTPHDAPRRSGG